MAELQTIIKINYADELDEFYRNIASEEQQDHFDFYDTQRQGATPLLSE